MTVGVVIEMVFFMPETVGNGLAGGDSQQNKLSVTAQGVVYSVVYQVYTFLLVQSADVGYNGFVFVSKPETFS